LSVITRVEVGRFDYDFVGEFKFFKPGSDGIVRRPTVLVRLTDADGNQGWGQSVPVPTWVYETAESVESTLRDYLAEVILGVEPDDLASIHKRMDRAIKPGFTTGMPICKAAVDIACYDLSGQQKSIPVVELLGGAQTDTILLNWTINSTDMHTVEQQLSEGRERGYRNYTVKVGPPQTPKYDLDLIKKIKSYAPESFLWADANTGYTLDTALNIAPKLADAGLEVLESPMPPNRLRDYIQLKKQGAIPIYMDEGIISPVEVQEFIALEMIDGITMKPARTAGIYHAQKIIQMAKDNGVGLLGSGLTDPDISLAASLHLYAWAGFERPSALNGPQFLANSLVQSDFQPEKDLARLPTGPGLGVRPGAEARACLRLAAEM
jgi:L-alanine-DL-glutamate epimerase-like enolase superfamily enzyme